MSQLPFDTKILKYNAGDPTQEYWACPDGMAHTWLFRRTVTGEGWYRCIRCSCRVEKRDLKRATDNPEL